MHLRALERIALTYKDQLDSSTTKYEEALARQSSTATPADARIISRATVPQDAAYPKKIPFILFGTIATFVLSAGLVVAGELLSGRASAGLALVEERQGAFDFGFAPEVVAAPRPAPVAKTDAARTDAAKTDAARTDATKADIVDPVAAARRRPRVADLESQGRKANLLRRLGLPPEDDLVFAPVESTSEVSVGETPARRRGLPSIDRLFAEGPLASAWAYVRGFGRSAAETREDVTEAEAPVGAGVGWDRHATVDVTEDHAEAVAHPTDATPVPAMEAPRQAKPVTAVSRDEAGTLVERIVAAHVPGRGLHIVGTGLDGDVRAPAMLIDLGRALSERGRGVIVDLNRLPDSLATLAGKSAVADLRGLAELLAGTASFAEVIHRDSSSRLHFIPTGGHEADFRDFDLVLDALSETYDFIILLAPSFPRSEIAKVMAPYADFVVLTSADDTDAATRDAFEHDLIAAGAREVLIAGRTAGAVQHVA